ncbi:hypothetical protein AeNC1_000471 [Aphanomyces euteiches]|nr:hypothetical protein AeNC1_000471 [Aphanomyces euteiches]
MCGCSKRSQVIFFIVIVSAVLTLLTDKGRQPTLDELSIFLGWSYFTCWSVSFYPQVLLNHRRKSVVGLSLDFLLLNFVGFLSYTVYNLGKYNAELDHGGVQLNDIVFSIHAFVLTTVCGIQCCIYRRPEQRVAIATRAMVFLAALGALLFGILVPISHESGVWTFHNFLTYLGCIKLAVTLNKYTPNLGGVTI